MAEKKGKKQKKKSNAKKGNFPVVVILVVLGIALAIGLYSYVFQRYVLSPYSRFRASHSEVRYPDGYSVRGIDISRYQGAIDWQKVKDAMVGGSTIQFVFIKATEGVTIFDPHFNDNFYKVREHGLLRGAYHFFTPSENGEKQAAHFLRQVHLEEGDLPPVLDVEEIGRLSGKQLRKEVLDWLKIVEAHYGVKPIIYSGYSFKKSYLNTPEFNDYPFWIAHYYREKLTYSGNWMFWQHTDLGDVEGINGDVDLNIFNGTIEDLNAITIDNIKEYN